MIKANQVKIKQAKQGLKLKVLCLSQIKVCDLILSPQLDVNEAYEHDIKDMQASLRRRIKWIGLIIKFKLDVC